jgi:ferredoxin
MSTPTASPSAAEAAPPTGADTEPGAHPAEVSVLVRTHPGLCEGWGNCHRFAAAVYPLDAEGYVDVHLLEVPPELAELARIGADVCPARAITVITRHATDRS